MVVVHRVKDFALSGFPRNEITDRLGIGQRDTQVGFRDKDAVVIRRSLVGLYAEEGNVIHCDAMFSQLVRGNEMVIQTWDIKNLIKEKNVSGQGVWAIIRNCKVDNGDFGDRWKVGVEAGHRDVV
jgi:transcriptional regulator of nitric oxide reductase